MFIELVSHEKEKAGRSVVKYVIGVITVILGLLAGYLPLIFVISRSGATFSELEKFQQTMDFNLLGINSNYGLLLIISSFISGLFALFLVVKVLHKRSVLTIITSYKKIRWQRIFFAFSLWLLLSGIIEIISYTVNPQDYIFSLDINLFIPLLIISLLLLPFQTSFEEIFIRGYLMQGFGLIGFYRIVPIIITSLIFGALHIANPEIENFGMPIMMAFYISFGLVLGIIAVMDDGLELPLGIHAANNIYASVIVSYSGGALQTNALFKVATIDVGFMFYGWLIISFLLLIIFSQKYGWVSWTKLFNKIDFKPPSTNI